MEELTYWQQKILEHSPKNTLELQGRAMVEIRLIYESKESNDIKIALIGNIFDAYFFLQPKVFWRDKNNDIDLE